MIVYRDQSRIVSTAAALSAIRGLNWQDHQAIRELLIEFGRLECGIADALQPHHPLLAEMRRIAVLTGRVFYRCCRRLPLRPPSDELSLALDRLSLAPLPEKVTLRTPEGYAFYALFPESYLAAAEALVRETQPREATVIGLRSIGTSLSAVVAGALAELDVRVATYTVRPRGHPFDRVTDLPAPPVGAGPHLIVDEGPGLSGSSMASVAEALSQSGVPDARIVFFPHWQPDVAALVSEKARARWVRHRCYLQPFDPALVRADLNDWTDISAGRWREIMFPSHTDFPAVQSQHERRKFLSPAPPRVLAKFAGLGARGRACFDRASKLHDAGFVPAPLEYCNGFLFTTFVAGRPATEVSAGLIAAAAKYLAHIFREFASSDPPATDQLLLMVSATVPHWNPQHESIAPLPDSGCWNLDGRMLRHEWIETAAGFLKTDAVDHGDDHFFPGPQDIAWDVAAAAIEFSLDDPAILLDRYARLSGDRTIRRRFPFYALAYSAFRFGYCQLALLSVDAAERQRFLNDSRRYLAWISRYSGRDRA